MGAGFLNVLSESDSDNNIILVGNPSKTLLKKQLYRILILENKSSESILKVTLV